MNWKRRRLNHLIYLYDICSLNKKEIPDEKGNTKTAIESSGFKDFKISNNVDFQKLYNLRKIQ